MVGMNRRDLEWIVLYSVMLVAVIGLFVFVLFGWD